MGKYFSIGRRAPLLGCWMLAAEVSEGPHRNATDASGFGRRPVSQASSAGEKRGRAPKEEPRPASFARGRATSSSCPFPSSRTSSPSSPFLHHLLRLRPTLNRKRSRPRMRSRVLSRERRYGASRAYIRSEAIYHLSCFFQSRRARSSTSEAVEGRARYRFAPSSAEGPSSPSVPSRWSSCPSAAPSPSLPAFTAATSWSGMRLSASLMLLTA